MQLTDTCSVIDVWVLASLDMWAPKGRWVVAMTAYDEWDLGDLL
jgi:hypothetical protein